MIFHTVQNTKKLYLAGLKNTAISQFTIKITKILQGKLSNTAKPKTYSKLLSTFFYMLQQFLTPILQFTLPFFSAINHVSESSKKLKSYLLKSYFSVLSYTLTLKLL